MGATLREGGVEGYDSAFILNRYGDYAINALVTPHVLPISVYKKPVIKLTGLLTENKVLHFPTEGFWTVWNGTTGAFTVNVKTAAGAVSLRLEQGYIGIFEADGAELRRIALCVPVATAALTAADATAPNSGDAATDTVISNIRTRVGEIETLLKRAGIITP